MRSLVGDASDPIRHYGAAIPPRSLVPGLEVRILAAETTHQGCVQLEAQLLRDVQCPGRVAQIEPVERLDVVDQLDLRHRCRIKQAGGSTLSLDQGKLIALDEG
jgi:hypothetical protein